MAKPPKFPDGYDAVIAETNYYGGQHFFIQKADGSLVDPLGKSIAYPISSYRLFRKENMEWYSIKGQVFHNDTYVNDPTQVPWDKVQKLEPVGYQIIDDDELRALQAKDAQVNDLVAQLEAVKKQSKIDLETCEKQRDKNQTDLATQLSANKELGKVNKELTKDLNEYTTIITDESGQPKRVAICPVEAPRESFISKVIDYILNLFKGVK